MRRASPDPRTRRSFANSCAAFAHRVGQLAVVVGEEQERRVLATSSPMNSSGICGASSSSAIAASSASGSALAVRRSPKARLPIWSWFCRKSTNAVGGRSPLGLPRGAPCDARTARPGRRSPAQAARERAAGAGRHSRRNSPRSRRSAAHAGRGGVVVPLRVEAAAADASAHCRRSPARGARGGPARPCARTCGGQLVEPVGLGDGVHGVEAQPVEAILLSQ